MSLNLQPAVLQLYAWLMVHHHASVNVTGAAAALPSCSVLGRIVPLGFLASAAVPASRPHRVSGYISRQTEHQD